MQPKIHFIICIQNVLAAKEACSSWHDVFWDFALTSKIPKVWKINGIIISRLNKNSHLPELQPNPALRSLHWFSCLVCKNAFLVFDCLVFTAFPEGTSGCLRSTRRPCTSGTQTSALKGRTTFQYPSTGKNEMSACHVISGLHPGLLKLPEISCNLTKQWISCAVNSTSPWFWLYKPWGGPDPKNAERNVGHSAASTGYLKCWSS